jgi:hypothetical protein
VPKPPYVAGQRTVPSLRGLHGFFLRRVVAENPFQSFGITLYLSSVAPEALTIAVHFGISLSM